MYNVDDAIAKIDGYVISISGGGPFVGESKLIKIDEVRRTAAYASIVTSNGVPGADDDEEAEEIEADTVPASGAVEEPSERSDDGAEPKLQSNGSTGRRRRGRRGGRRRSRASGSSSSSK
ncbi:MAG: TRAM domain-containing protein, partial [Solirubrobacterales bacterium]